MKDPDDFEKVMLCMYAALILICLMAILDILHVYP
jgi:hypothetical protein